MSRILLADDSPQALRLGEQILSAQGMEVVSVTDGAVAMRRLSDVNPDLLITDVFLPTKSGFDLARFMKAEAAFRDIPIVFAATAVETFNEQDARHAGADAILRKPFEASSLLDTVQTLIEKRAHAKRNAAPQGGNSFDRAAIRAAVTLALDSAMPVLIEEMTERVILALSHRG
jgi:chemosensory pili system protein ChpA (sensor histidine kinase/response regulator)